MRNPTAWPEQSLLSTYTQVSFLKSTLDTHAHWFGSAQRQLQPSASRK
jgi:hypothetical protein